MIIVSQCSKFLQDFLGMVWFTFNLHSSRFEDEVHQLNDDALIWLHLLALSFQDIEVELVGDLVLRIIHSQIRLPFQLWFDPCHMFWSTTELFEPPFQSY